MYQTYSRLLQSLTNGISGASISAGNEGNWVVKGDSLQRERCAIVKKEERENREKKRHLVIHR